MASHEGGLARPRKGKEKRRIGAGSEWEKDRKKVLILETEIDSVSNLETEPIRSLIRGYIIFNFLYFF